MLVAGQDLRGFWFSQSGVSAGHGYVFRAFKVIKRAVGVENQGFNRRSPFRLAVMGRDPRELTLDDVRVSREWMGGQEVRSGG